MTGAPAATTAAATTAAAAPTDVPAAHDPVSAECALVEHLVLPAAMAHLGGHCPRAATGDPDELLDRAGATERAYFTASSLAPGPDSVVVVLRCLSAAQRFFTAAHLERCSGRSRTATSLWATSAVSAALELDAEPGLALALRLVLGGVPLEQALVAAEAATS